MSVSPAELNQQMEQQIAALSGNDGISIHEEADQLSQPETYTATGVWKTFTVAGHVYEIMPVKYRHEQRLLKFARAIEHLELTQYCFVIERLAQVFLERFIRPEGMRLQDALMATAQDVMKDAPATLKDKLREGPKYIDELVDEQVEQFVWTVVDFQNYHRGIKMSFEEFLDGLEGDAEMSAGERLRDVYNGHSKIIKRVAELGKSTMRRLKPLLEQIIATVEKNQTGDSPNMVSTFASALLGEQIGGTN
jgi:hypothetical protein